MVKETIKIGNTVVKINTEFDEVRTPEQLAEERRKMEQTFSTILSQKQGMDITCTFRKAPVSQTTLQQTKEEGRQKPSFKESKEDKHQFKSYKGSLNFLSVFRYGGRSAQVSGGSWIDGGWYGWAGDAGQLVSIAKRDLRFGDLINRTIALWSDPEDLFAIAGCHLIFKPQPERPATQI